MLRKYPFYIKFTTVLFGLSLLVLELYTIQDTLVPLAFALVLGILLNPVVNKLQKWHWPKVVAISAAILLSAIVIAAIGYFLVYQIGSFSDQLPQFKKKFLEMATKVQNEVASSVGITKAKQEQYVSEAGNSLKPVVGTAAGGIFGMFAMIFLLPVYSFLFLYYKDLLINFLYEVFAEEDEKEIKAVLTQTKGAIQSYMYGLVLEAMAVAIMNSIALLLIGVKYAILLGVVGALLNILPYIGGIIAILLPVLIAIVTKDGFNAPLLIVGAYAVIQFIDNQFLVPYIVASKVQINALASIIVVLLGGQLWGISGMFLSIPFVGILKIVFDRLPELKPWGKLLGDELPTRVGKRAWTKRAKAT